MAATDPSETVRAQPMGLLAALEAEPKPPVVSNRLLLILTLALAAAFIVTALISWWVWHTPALVPVDLESVPRG